MRTYGLLCLVVGLLVSCSHPTTLIVASSPSQSRSPRIDDEPEGEVPSFYRLHERAFEPHWL